MTRTFVADPPAANGDHIVSMITGDVASGLSGMVRTAGPAPQSTLQASSVIAAPLRRIRDVEAPAVWPAAIVPMTTTITTLDAAVGAAVVVPGGNYLGGEGSTALASSGAIRGPITVPANKLDWANSSMIGGVEVSYATAADGDKFFIIEEITLSEDLEWGAHTLVTGMTMFTMAVGAPATAMTMATSTVVFGPRGALPPAGALAALFTGGGPPSMLPNNFITFDGAATGSIASDFSGASVTNKWQLTFTSTMGGGAVMTTLVDVLGTGDITVGAEEVATALVFPHIAGVIRTAASVHQRRGHLAVAACNLDAPRLIDDAFDISPTEPYSGIGGGPFTGLATLHMSSLASSSRGDLEIPLLNDALAGGPGPSGAFLDWPDGYTGGNFDDDIRGGDSDDLLFGEIGQDTVRGDHGDDTIAGEGDAAAWVLGDAVLNLGPAIDVFDQEVGGVPTFVYARTRKLPVGLSVQYAGGAGADSLTGNDDDDWIDGGGGADHLVGGPDDDRLDGGAGADQIDGSDGYDACANGFVTDCEVIL